jgi:hypothetical protein
MSTDSTDVHYEEDINKSVRLYPPDRAALDRLVASDDNDWGDASAAIRGLIREADEQADSHGGPPEMEGREPPSEDDLADVCEEEDGYCAHCHSRIAGGGPF